MCHVSYPKVPRTCYGVKVRATYSTGRNSTESYLKTICTLPQPPHILSQHSNTNRIKVNKLRVSVYSQFFLQSVL